MFNDPAMKEAAVNYIAAMEPHCATCGKLLNLYPGPVHGDCIQVEGHCGQGGHSLTTWSVHETDLEA